MLVNQIGARSNRLAVRLGFWSAFSIAVVFLVFTLCFIAIPLTSPLFVWSNFEAYLAHVRGNSQFFPDLARFMMLLFGPLLVALLNSIYELATNEKRLLARLSLLFGVTFATLTGINYFVQLSAVRLSVLKGETQGLEQLLQANPNSLVAAINLLGWSLFLGLSSLFAAATFPLFSTKASRLERVISIAFLLNGIFCILGGIGYVFDIVVLIFFALNFGMGGAVLTAVIALALLFRRMESVPLETRQEAPAPLT